MALLRPGDVDELLARTGLSLPADIDRARLGPHGALDGRGRPVIVFFVPKPANPAPVLERFARIGGCARRIGAEVATPEVAHVLTDWLVFVERASGEELCLADWLALRPSASRRRLVAERLRSALASVHAHRFVHGSLCAEHVLVGEGGEVVLTGLSLRASGPEQDTALAAEEDGVALVAMLEALLGAEHREWTAAGFVAPPLAATGTLTVVRPSGPELATPEDERTLSDVHAAHAGPVARVPPVDGVASDHAGVRPAASESRAVRPAIWAFAVLALASVVGLGLVLASRAVVAETAPSPKRSLGSKDAEERNVQDARDAAVNDGGAGVPVPLGAADAGAPATREERAVQAPAPVNAKVIPATKPPRRRLPTPSGGPRPARDLLEDALPPR